MFSQGTGPYISTGEGENLFGGTLERGTARVPHPQLALTLPSPQPEPHQSPAQSGIPTSGRTCPPRPIRFPAEPGVLPRGAPALLTRRRSRVLRPGGIVYHPQQKRPKQPWVWGRRGERAHPRGPGGRADAEPRPTSSPSGALPLSTPSGLRVWLPGPLPSAPTPTHHWPPQAPRAARVPPAPSLHQPSGKLSNLRSSPQLRSPGPRGARGARAGPGRTPTGSWQGQGPSPRGGRLLPKGPQRKGR